mmetsp:Transcript_74451/g.198573  ORF Transcript_74451/g.198573 Transcript_74451/m.198573 type:complete len:233 (-) Transcript_74451:840-1538(-)
MLRTMTTRPKKYLWGFQRVSRKPVAIRNCGECWNMYGALATTAHITASVPSGYTSTASTAGNSRLLRSESPHATSGKPTRVEGALGWSRHSKNWKDTLQKEMYAADITRPIVFTVLAGCMALILFTKTLISQVTCISPYTLPSTTTGISTLIKNRARNPTPVQQIEFTISTSNMNIRKKSKKSPRMSGTLISKDPITLRVWMAVTRRLPALAISTAFVRAWLFGSCVVRYTM